MADTQDDPVENQDNPQSSEPAGNETARVPADDSLPPAGAAAGNQPAQSSSHPTFFAADSNKYPGADQNSVNDKTAADSPRRKLFGRKTKIITGLTLTLILAGGGYVFGYYLPNRPQNVYNTGLDRTGQALSAMVNTVSEAETYQKFKRSKLTADFTASFSGQTVSGNLDSTFDPDKMNAKFATNFPAPDGSGKQQSLDLSLISELKKKKKLPDSYFKLKGIKGFGLEQFLPGINKYDDKWIEISSDYLESIIGPENLVEFKAKNDETTPSFDDFSSFIRQISQDADEYLFTSNPDKAVLVNKKFLGKDDLNGLSAYHYEVGINKGNYEKLCRAVSETLIDSQLYKKFSGGKDSDNNKFKQDAAKQCEKQANEIKDSDSFEMWVDSKSKLIHKLRFYDEKNRQNYFEIGQNYKGGQEIDMFSNLHYPEGDGSFDGKINLTTNLQTGNSAMEANFETGGPQKVVVKIAVKAAPYQDEINTTPPPNAVKLEEVLKAFGVDPKDFQSPSQPSSEDPFDQPSGRDLLF